MLRLTRFAAFSVRTTRSAMKSASLPARLYGTSRDGLLKAGALASLVLDVPFERAFGSEASVDTLKHLLNSMLRSPCGGFSIERIDNVEIKSVILRTRVYDVQCTLSSGDKVIVELQKFTAVRGHVVDCVFGYLARAYAEQWARASHRTLSGAASKWIFMYRLVPVRVLALLDFTTPSDLKECGSLVQHYHLQHAKTDATQVPDATMKERLAALSGITIVQLPLAPKEVTHDTPDAAKWAHLLHHSREYTFESLPAPLRAGPFGAAATSARIDTMSEDELDALDGDEVNVREFNSVTAELTAAEQRAASAVAARVAAASSRR